LLVGTYTTGIYVLTGNYEYLQVNI